MLKISCSLQLLILISGLPLANAGDPKLPQLAGEVEIRRTTYGVPHILGQSEAAAAFGFGYCQAEDHLLSIMRQMLIARGESAKFFGKGNLETDFESRQFRIHARAEETYHKLDPEFRKILEGYAAGFNYYIELRRENLPNWVQPLTPHDVAAHGMAGVMRFAFDRGGIIGAFLRKQKKEAAGLLDDNPAEHEVGSNMWAFSPERTKSGKTILMGNPHQPWAEVSTYYEAHVTVPGKLNFYGSTFVGRPILTSGFNENLGWSHTVNYPDLEEIYEVDLDPHRPDHYLFDGGSVAMQGEEVTIEYKENDALKTETRTFWHTPLGPVILRTAEKIYVLRSACYDEYRSYEQWYRMSKAKDFKGFRGTLDMLAVPMFNICYADRDGNIFYVWNGMVPRFPHPAHTSEAVHATKSSELWTEFHPVADLPQLFNPKGGYVQNCNDPPYFTNLNEVIDWKKFPDYFGPARLGLRTQHSLTLVDNAKKFSLEEVRDMKFSPRMLLADRVKDDLIDALLASNPNEEVKKAAQLLKEWDNTASAESRGSTLFATWWQRFGMQPAGASDAYEAPWVPEKPMETPHGIGNKPRAVETFLRAMEETQKAYGSWDVKWGDAHRVRRGSVDVPVSGGSGFMGCFRVLDFKKADDGKQVVSGGDSWIFTVEFDDPPKAYSVVGYSQSEVETSPYFNDQTPLYANNQMKKVAFTEGEIKEQLVKSYHPGSEIQ